MSRGLQILVRCLALCGSVWATGLELHAQAPARPRVEPLVLVSPSTAVSIPKRKNKYSLKVSQPGWVPTGVPLRNGDVLTVSATGAVSLADGRSAAPEGVGHGWRDMLRQFPLPEANTGALVGRVGNSAAGTPFLIGASASVPVYVDGDLYLRVNAPESLFSSGTYKVEVRLAEPHDKATPEAAPTTTQFPVSLIPSLPRRVEDSEHRPGDVINLALVGSHEQIQDAFVRAGWVAVDKSVDEAILNGLFATLEHRPYVAVPMSTLYLFGRPQDMSYARADTIRVAAVRHHLRLWKSDFEVKGQPLWLGSATFDNGFERDERSGGITHRIDEKIDEERDFIRDSFRAAGVVASGAYLVPGEPFVTGKTATGGSFVSDGRVLILELRSLPPISGVVR